LSSTFDEILDLILFFTVSGVGHIVFLHM